MPIEEPLALHLEFQRAPFAYVYRLTTRPEQGDTDSDEAEDGGAFGGLRRWFSRPAVAA
jgi:hypothetical protein